MLPPRLPVVIPLLGRVVSDHQCVLGQLLEEALGRGAVNVEVERLRDGAHGEQGEGEPHDVGSSPGEPRLGKSICGVERGRREGGARNLATQ